MDEDIFSALFNILNLAFLALYLVLSGIVFVVLWQRWRTYRLAKQSTPVLLKRDLVLFTALIVTFAELTVIRAFGITVFQEPGLPRLLFVLQENIIGIGALAYWAKVELTDFK